MSIATASRTGLTSKLREHFGFRRFRPGQEKVVRSALAGRDTLALMPTGSGKSLCFQLPGLVMEGSTVVISPLIALMKDQTEALAEKGIRAVAFNSTMSPRERQEAEDVVRAARRSSSTRRPSNWPTASSARSCGGRRSICSWWMRRTA